MDISIDETNHLFTALESMGWQRKGELVVAPHGTMWLLYHCPWVGTLNDMHERMRGRLARIIANRDSRCVEADVECWRQSYDDTFSLLKCLESTLRYHPYNPGACTYLRRCPICNPSLQ
jgi:hypothetical protein